MPRRNRRELALDFIVGLTAVVALALVLRERVAPWIAGRSVLDPGETVKEPPALVDAETGDSVSIPRGADHLLLVFRSTCPTCERTAPAWNRLSASEAWQTTAVGLEHPEGAAAYGGVHMPKARIAVPVDIDRFTSRFRITVVPTTMLIDRTGRLLARHAGPLGKADLAALRRHVEPPYPDSI